MATHSSILAGESHGQRNLMGYSPWGSKESDRTERMSTHAVFVTKFSPKDLYQLPSFPSEYKVLLSPNHPKPSVAYFNFSKLPI